MSVVTFKRKKLETVNTETATVALGAVVQQGNDFYLPIVLDNFTVPNVTIPLVTGASGQSKMSSLTPNYFKKVKVGDELVSGIDVVPPVNVTASDLSFTIGSNVVVYPSTMTSATLQVKVGDEILSTAVPGGSTFVDRIDYVNKLIYITEDATSTVYGSVQVKKPVRITAKNTAGTEITISTNLAQSGVDAAAAYGGVVFKKGATEALLCMLKVSPVGSSTGGNVSIQVSGYKGSGDKVEYTANASGASAPQSLNYVNLGTLSLDADEFLESAGIPRV